MVIEGLGGKSNSKLPGLARVLVTGELLLASQRREGSLISRCSRCIGWRPGVARSLARVLWSLWRQWLARLHEVLWFGTSTSRCLLWSWVKVWRFCLILTHLATSSSQTFTPAPVGKEPKQTRCASLLCCDILRGLGVVTVDWWIASIERFWREAPKETDRAAKWLIRSRCPSARYRLWSEVAGCSNCWCSIVMDRTCNKSNLSNLNLPKSTSRGGQIQGPDLICKSKSKVGFDLSLQTLENFVLTSWIRGFLPIRTPGDSKRWGLSRNFDRYLSTSKGSGHL